MLNTGINRHNFFTPANVFYQKNGTDSVNLADSGDTTLLLIFPGNSILKCSAYFLKSPEFNIFIPYLLALLKGFLIFGQNLDQIFWSLTSQKFFKDLL